MAPNGIQCLGYELSGDESGYNYTITAFTDLTDVIGDETVAVLAPVIPDATKVAFSYRMTAYVAE